MWATPSFHNRLLNSELKDERSRQQDGPPRFAFVPPYKVENVIFVVLSCEISGFGGVDISLLTGISVCSEEAVQILQAKDKNVSCPLLILFFPDSGERFGIYL